MLSNSWAEAGLIQLNFVLINSYPSTGYYMAQILHLFHPKLALAFLSIKLAVQQDLEHLSNMLYMFLQIGVVHKNIIKKHQHKFF